jgi:hypothetical protein
MWSRFVACACNYLGFICHLCTFVFFSDCAGETSPSTEDFICAKCLQRMQRLDQECQLFLHHHVFAPHRASTRAHIDGASASSPQVESSATMIHALSGLKVAVAPLNFQDTEIKTKVTDAMLQQSYHLLRVTCTREDDRFRQKVPIVVQSLT